MFSPSLFCMVIWAMIWLLIILRRVFHVMDISLSLSLILTAFTTW